MAALEDTDTSDESADVLVVGSDYVRTRDDDTGETVLNPRRAGIEPRCTSISETLPLQWYIEVHDAQGTCAVTVEDATTIVAEQGPTVVIAPPTMEDELADELDGYRASTYRLRTTGNDAVFFVRTDN
jgi:predicted membrane-bound mannosyltransferase